VVKQMEEVFEKDWAQTPSGRKEAEEGSEAGKQEKKEKKVLKLAKAS